MPEVLCIGIIYQDQDQIVKAAEIKASKHVVSTASVLIESVLDKTFLIGFLVYVKILLSWAPRVQRRHGNS